MNIRVEDYIWGPPVVGIEIRNKNDEKIEVEWVRMEWPPENIFHKKLDLDGAVIWDDGNPGPPTWATSLKGNRYINGDSSKPLVGVFSTAFPGSYEMEVGFTNGCVVYGNP